MAYSRRVEDTGDYSPPAYSAPAPVPRQVSTGALSQVAAAAPVPAAVPAPTVPPPIASPSAIPSPASPWTQISAGGGDSGDAGGAMMWYNSQTGETSSTPPPAAAASSYSGAPLYIYQAPGTSTMSGSGDQTSYGSSPGGWIPVGSDPNTAVPLSAIPSGGIQATGLGNTNESSLGLRGEIYQDSTGNYYDQNGKKLSLTPQQIQSALQGQAVAQQQAAAHNASHGFVGDLLSNPLFQVAAVGTGLAGMAGVGPLASLGSSGGAGMAEGWSGAGMDPTLAATNNLGITGTAAFDPVAATAADVSTPAVAPSWDALAPTTADASTGPLTQMASNAPVTDVPVQWDTTPTPDVTGSPVDPNAAYDPVTQSAADVTTTPTPTPDLPAPKPWTYDPSVQDTFDQSLGAGVTPPPPTVSIPGYGDIYGPVTASTLKDVWSTTKDFASVANAAKAMGLTGDKLNSMIRSVTGLQTPSALRGALSLLSGAGMLSLMNAKPGAAPTAHPGGLSAAGSLGTGAWGAPRAQSASRFGFADGGSTNDAAEVHVVAAPLKPSSGEFLHYLLDHALGREDMLDRWAKTAGVGNPEPTDLVHTALDAISAHKSQLDNMARGGSPTGARMSMADKRRHFFGLLRGGSGGQDDEIPAALSDGEYVMDADTVSSLGDGNNEAGAKKLDEFRNNIRQHKRSGPLSSIPPKAKPLAKYLPKGK